MSHEATAAAIGTSLPLFEVLLSNASLVPVIVADVQAIGAATDVKTRWAGVKKLGDDLEPVIEQLAGTQGQLLKATPADVERLNAMPAVGKFGDGHLITLLIQNGPAIINLIKQIIPLFTGGK